MTISLPSEAVADEADVAEAAEVLAALADVEAALEAYGKKHVQYDEIEETFSAEVLKDLVDWIHKIR